MDQTILKTIEEVRHWFEPRKDVYSFDFETTGLNYITMEAVGVSFHDGERSTYIDLWENAEANEILDFLGPIFERGTFIAHNVKFDIKCTRKFCHTNPKDVFCTYIASFLLNENRPAHGLKVLAVEDLHVSSKEISKWEQSKEFGYHSEQWYRYCFNDAEWAYALYRLYGPKLSMEGLDHVFYHIEMPFVFVAADMEINGIKVDMQTLKDLELKTRNKLIELEDRMFASVGMFVTEQRLMFEDSVERVHPKNLRSHEQLKQILKKKCGIIVKDTKKQTIEKLKGKHPFIDYLLDYKKVRKLYDAYIVPAFDLVDPDGRIRPSFGIVKTGRTNCKKPNLQQLPNLSKSFPDLNYRGIFIADSGNKLVGGDYSGQELRVLGEVSQDVTIIDSFRNNFDLHLVTANYIFQLGLDPQSIQDGTEEHKSASIRYKTERYKAKNGVNFPIVYGSSEYGISHNMGVSVETAKEWRNKFFELYPQVFEAMEETKLELEEYNHVRTMMGRKRRFPEYPTLPKYSKGKLPSKTRAVRQAFNFKIQGFSADQIKIAANLFREWTLLYPELDVKILMIIHDELVVEGGKDAATIIADALKKCMESAVSLSIPFVSDVKIGDRYSELK